MTNRDRIWIKARRWVSGWQGGKSTPTPHMAYLAGWQAAMREQRKALKRQEEIKAENNAAYHGDIDGDFDY